MELPYFKIRFNITKGWLKSAFFDLDKNVKITDEMLEEIKDKMSDWLWEFALFDNRGSTFYDDWNEALYNLLEKVDDKEDVV